MNGTKVQRVKQVTQALESNRQQSLDWSLNSESLLPASPPPPAAPLLRVLAKSGLDGVRSQTLKGPM